MGGVLKQNGPVFWLAGGLMACGIVAAIQYAKIERLEGVVEAVRQEAVEARAQASAATVSEGVAKDSVANYQAILKRVMVADKMEVKLNAALKIDVSPGAPGLLMPVDFNGKLCQMEIVTGYDSASKELIFDPVGFRCNEGRVDVTGLVVQKGGGVLKGAVFDEGGKTFLGLPEDTELEVWLQTKQKQ